MRRRATLLSLSGGLAVIVVSLLAAPLGSPPLYDGVVVQDPYRYVVPGPGQEGSPTSFLTPLPVDGTTSPRFIAATSESPPQAELIAPPGAFVVVAGVTTLAVSIDPVQAPAPPSAGTIAGNVYRFAVADQTGVDLAVMGDKDPIEEDDEVVTYAEPSRFFSFRRDGRTGRMAAAVWIEVGRGR